MSQFFISVPGGSPSIPTNFVADSGSATPAANTLNILGNDTTADNANGISTSGSGSTITVLLTNRLQGTGSAVGAVTADLITFPLSASAAVYRFQFYVAGRDTTSGDGVGYTVFGSARTTGAAATIISTPFVDTDEDASLTTSDLTIVASGNSVILRATGVAGQTINYSAVGTYVVV